MIPAFVVDEKSQFEKTDDMTQGWHYPGFQGAGQEVVYPDKRFKQNFFSPQKITGMI